MANIRMSRINGEIQKSIAEIITTKLYNPSLEGLIISVLDVDTTPDLSLAKVAISVLTNDESKKKMVIDELNKAKNHIRHEVSRQVRLRIVPELVFNIDNSYEKSQSIYSLLDKISSKNKEN